MASWAPACETCGAKVPAATRLDRVRCDDCLTDQERDRQLRLEPRTTSARTLKATRRNPHTGKREPACDHCGAPNPRKSFQLDPRNWRERHALLCGPCRTKLGYREVDFARADRHGGYIEPTIRRRA